MKRHICIVLATAMLFSGIILLPNEAHAITFYQKVTKYHLDMGALHIWGTGPSQEDAIWQGENEKGGTMDVSVTLELSEEVSNVKAYPLTNSNFKWNTINYDYNGTDYLYDRGSYIDFYQPYASEDIHNITCSSSGNTVNLSYTAALSSNSDFDLKYQLNMNGLEYIFDLLGGEPLVARLYPDTHDRLVEGSIHGIADNVYGYMYFVLIVIQYDVLEEVEVPVGDFIPYLEAPAQAKTGETFTVTGGAAFDQVEQFAEAQLSYQVNSGSKKNVPGWNSSLLENEIKQSFNEECNVTYTLTVWNIYGDSKTLTKTVKIVDEKEITVTPILSTPEYSYEGHSFLAEDQSTFVVNGTNYSAPRAYAEGIADNSFYTSGSYGSVSRLTNTEANIVFSKAGNYTIKLAVDPAGGSTVYATNPHEVRKTPEIIDNLSGFQKQNRKQILNITVPTYPGKPLTDYSITLKDKKTGEAVLLTSGNPQQNSATIKTRAVTITQDLEKGFAYITVEFLTKTPGFAATGTNTQDFSYEIHVTDSKGDTDVASRTFTVMPDLPPATAISLDSVFLRNEGTNTASITAEDVTVAADGDSVARTWYYGAGTAPSTFTNVSTLDGYKKLSFGTDKIVGFNKTGVGKFTAKLNVKEVWTEPTLEEYVTDADHLTGSTTAISDVQNVAPIVSLELLNSTEQDVLLLANNDSEYQTLLNNKTVLQQALLANKIDGNIIIKKLVGSTPPTVTGLQQQRALSFPYPAKARGDGLATEVNESNLLAVDSEKTYFLTYTWIDGTATVPKTIHAINNFSSGEAWSYTTSRNEDFSYGQDDTGKYLYLIYKGSNQTVLLDKRTGAVAGTINIALSDKVWLTDTLAFMVENGSLYAVNLNSLTKTMISAGAAAASRVGGNLQYIENTSNAVVRCTLDMETLEVSRDVLINIAPGASAPGDYIPVCIDSTGKAVIFKDAKSLGSDTFRGVIVYSPKNEQINKIAVLFSTYYDETYNLDNIFPALNEQGICNQILLWEHNYDSTVKDMYKMTGVNVDTGAIASYSQRTSAYNSLPYGGSFQSGGTSYYMFEGWYIYPGGTGYRDLNYTFSFNGSSVSVSNTVPGVSGTPYAENIQVSDRAVAEFNGDNTPSTGTFSLGIIGFPRTLAQKTAEIISRFAGKLTFQGNIYTTADQIKAAAEAPKPTVKVTAANDGYLSLSNLSLLPGRKYYYEYEIKPLVAGTESRLNGMAAATGTTTSDQSFLSDTLYVEKSYEEDFNDGSVNNFFTVNDGGAFYNGKYGAEADQGDGYMQISFTVPSGRQATVSLDSFLYFNNSTSTNATSSKYAETNVFIDGMRISEKDVYGNNINYDSDAGLYTYFEENKTGVLFYKLLGPGTHTIECRVSVSDWRHVLIDNLKVGILSGTAPALSPTANTQQGVEKGWLDVNGSFATPNRTISYGAQAATTFYGPINYSATQNGKTQTLAYTQTVPAGYIQKGQVHLTSSYLTDYAEYTINGVTKLRYQKTTVNGWVNFGAKPEGSYDHTVYMQRADRSPAYLDVFDLITYPNNAVTITGNMAFDNSNTKYYFPKTTSTGTTNLSIFLPQGEYLFKNLKLYYIEDGKKILLQNRDLDEVSDLTGWSLSPGLISSVYAEPKEEPDDAPVKIYEKGEKVLYNIFYDDYENDPSKTQCWVYQHVNWPPDGVHPDVGKVLNAPIDRFYLSGKYTVTHWQQDNTQRTGTVGDATPYNKESNKVDLTFYVNGDGNAPWITYIKTNPYTVKENNTYTLAVGVDDAEKDTLTLETEVYRDGKSIFTHKRENLQANAAGVYPETLISGLPAAQVGVYQVICTVRDWSGTGIGSYRFTVVSEGKITGFVNHTDQWDNNRKKYNLERFDEEMNRPMLLDDYIAMPTPRKRGTNIFWSGEKFLLRAETEGEPWKVDVQIQTVSAQGARINTEYTAELADTGRQAPSGADLWEGSLWDNTMINKWGRKEPEQLYFVFTAHYTGGTVKTSEASVIIDSRTDYWRLHRLW